MALAPDRVDWRWVLASDATQYTQGQALHRLQGADPTTTEAYHFKRAADAGRDLSKWPALEAALELRTNRAGERLFIEGMLLAGAESAYTASLVGCAPEDIHAYHDVFFDVKPRLHQPGWVVSKLFQGALYQNLNPRDRIAQMHRIAWLGGVEIFEAYYTGRRVNGIKEQLVDLIRDMMSKQTLLHVGCVGGGDEVKMDLLRIFIDDTNQKIAETVQGSLNDKASGEAIMGFLNSMSMRVVDPTDPANLTLPAREPRAAEYMIQSGVTNDAQAHV